MGDLTGQPPFMQFIPRKSGSLVLLQCSAVPVARPGTSPTAYVGDPWAVPLIQMSRGLSSPTSQSDAQVQWLSAASGKCILRHPGKGAFPLVALPRPISLRAARNKSQSSTGSKIGLSSANVTHSSLQVAPFSPLLRLVSPSTRFQSFFRPRAIHFDCF